MQKKSKLITKVGLSTLLLITTISFTNCTKDDINSSNLSEETSLNNEDSQLLASTTNAASTGTLNIKSLKSDGGYAYKFTERIANGDVSGATQQSILKLYENGVEIGPAHTEHDEIRKNGNGTYSHWGSTLIFSASDNTDPRTNGRTYTYVLDSKSSTPSTPNKPEISSGIMGYAMVNGSTTGGQGGTEVTVTTLDALKSALNDNAAKIIYVSGTIKGAGADPIYVKSNKSIIGKSGAVLQGLQLFVYGVNNVIIQNITFRNYVTYAAVQIKDKAHHVWIDHCDFANDKNRGWDYWGKDIAITRESDYVTVSWNKFHDTFLSVLISGGIEGHESDKGKLRVTMHHNFWYNVSEREPSMNFGRVHMFNNYHLNNSGYGIGVRAGGIVRTDNEYFSNCTTPLSTKIGQDPEGYFSGINTNIYDKSGPNKITTAESNWVPEYEYKSYLHNAADVPSIVTSGAGPR